MYLRIVETDIDARKNYFIIMSPSYLEFGNRSFDEISVKSFVFLCKES